MRRDAGRFAPIEVAEHIRHQRGGRVLDGRALPRRIGGDQARSSEIRPRSEGVKGRSRGGQGEIRPR